MSKSTPTIETLVHRDLFYDIYIGVFAIGAINRINRRSVCVCFWKSFIADTRSVKRVSSSIYVCCRSFRREHISAIIRFPLLFVLFDEKKNIVLVQYPISGKFESKLPRVFQYRTWGEKEKKNGCQDIIILRNKFCYSSPINIFLYKKYILIINIRMLWDIMITQCAFLHTSW